MNTAPPRPIFKAEATPEEGDCWESLHFPLAFLKDHVSTEGEDMEILSCISRFRVDDGDEEHPFFLRSETRYFLAS